MDKIKSGRLKSGKKAKLARQKDGLVVQQVSWENSGPPNCLICMRGASVTVEVEPLLQDECSHLMKLLKFSPKLKQDFKGSRAYACSQCLGKVKTVSELYKQIERINIRLGETKDFFEKGFLNSPTPTAKAVTETKPDFATYATLRRRMAKELQNARVTRMSRPGPSDTTNSTEDDSDSAPNDDNRTQSFCEAVMEGSDSDEEGNDSESDSASPRQGKRNYRDIKCDFCDMTYKCYRSLQKHLNRIHFDILPFPCQSCDQGFTTKDRLEKHENAAHLGFKNNECRICRKVFSRRQAMKNHLATHTGVRSFQCELCDKSYLADSALRNHMDSIHGNKKFVCEVCGKEQPSRHYLISHMKVHQEKKPGMWRRRKLPTQKDNNNSESEPSFDSPNPALNNNNNNNNSNSDLVAEDNPQEPSMENDLFFLPVQKADPEPNHVL